MKKTKKRRIILIISAVLICAMLLLLPLLSACKNPEESSSGNNNNAVHIGNNDKTGNDPDNSPDPVENLGASTTDINDVYTSKEIADAIMTVYAQEELPEAGMEYFFSGADEKGANYLDPEKAGLLINGSPMPVQEFDYLEDYALYTPMGKNIFEVDVFKVKKDEMNHFNAVKEILDKRLKRKDNGDVALYVPEDAPILANAKVMTVGSYVILLATTDNSRAENVMNNMFAGGGNSSLSNSNSSANNDNDTEDKAEEQTQAPANRPVSMEEVVNIEPEILFDVDQFSVEPKKLIVKEPENITEPEKAEEIEPPQEVQETPEIQDDTQRQRKTPVPRVDVKSYSHNTSFLVGGKCEVGAMIRVTGGTEEIYTGSDHGDYLVEVPFSPTGTTTLRLTAELDGRLPSDEISFIVKPQKNISYFEDNGAYGVVIGYNYMSYFEDCMADFVGSNLINDKEIENLKTRTAKRISDLKSKGCNAEIIYLLIPNTVRIWPEDVPRRYTYYQGDTLLRQWKEGVTAGGATVLDLTDLMMAHKNDEFKIWHKTDSHWSEYGALLGYEALMNHIAKKFPDAAPRPRSDFEIFNQEVNFGDIYATLGLTLSDLRETSTFVKFNFDPPHYNKDYDTGHVNIYDENCAMRMSVRPLHIRVQFPHTTESNVSGNLPTAFFFRDSFEGPMHAFYTDRFKTATFNGMWDYNFKIDNIAKLNPDYIIYIISERNIKAVLYN